jgi:hypothetical protein
MNGRVAEYRDLAESLALKIAGGTRAKQVGAEVDDLAQEGLIDVWQALERGVTPSAEMMENRMRSYVRWLGTQVGASRDGNVPYEALLPLDDYRSAVAVGGAG